jgi:hypothetical protein
MDINNSEQKPIFETEVFIDKDKKRLVEDLHV